MPPAPRIQSESVRNTILAVLMGLLLLGSLGLGQAYVAAVRPSYRLTSGPAQQLSFGELAFTVPGQWQLAQQRGGQVGLASAMLVTGARPNARLAVNRAVTREPVAALDILRSSIVDRSPNATPLHSLEGGLRITVGKMDGGVAWARLLGYRQPVPQAIELHFVQVYTLDQTTYWTLEYHDAVLAGDDPKQVVRHARQQFLEIAATATLTADDAG